MSKLLLNTLEEVKEYSFEKASIFTITYNKVLKENEIHTPNAAKIIIEGDGIISAFIVLQPLVNVNSNGDVTIHTPSTIKQATLEEKYMLKNYIIKDVKRDLKILDAKFKLGLSIDELMDLNVSRAHLEAMILEERIESPYKGGGF